MRRQFFTAHALSDGLVEGQLVFDLVTGDKDTFKTVLRPEGARFRPAKPWLNAHDDKSCKKVIGRMADEPLEQSTDRLRVLVNFDLESPEAAEVYRKHKAGFLEGCSVGFNPIKWHIEEIDGEDTLVYDEYDVLEGSSCAVPSNPMALMQRSADQAESARLKLDDALRAKRSAAAAAQAAVVQFSGETPYDAAMHHAGFDMEEEDLLLSLYPGAHRFTLGQLEEALASFDKRFTRKTGKPSMVTQSLIFSKERFKTADAAKAGAKDHGFKSHAVDETEDSFRLRQREPSDFAEGSLRTITLTDGVQAVQGHLKSSRAVRAAVARAAAAHAAAPNTRAAAPVEPASTFDVRDIHHPKAETQGKTSQMKPEHRSLHRYMIGSSLGRAADHMEAMGAFPAGHEHRAYHRGCAERAMDDASHMTRMVMDSLEEGHDDAAADAEMIGSMIRACAVKDDEALAKRWETCQRAALAFASTTWRDAGKQIGVASPDDLITQIRAHEAVAAQHKKLLAQHRSAEQASVAAERSELVKGLVSKGLVSPALEAEMLGFDPADPKRERKSARGAWAPERIRRFAMQVEGALPEIVTRAVPLVTTDGKQVPQSDFVPGVPDVKQIPQTRSTSEEAIAAAIAGSAKYLGIKPETIANHAAHAGRK